METYTLLAAAWILWQTITFYKPHQTDWSYIDAYDERQECEDIIPGMLENASRSKLTRKVLSRTKTTLTVIGSNGEQEMIRLLCVPDTVDPRPRPRN